MMKAGTASSNGWRWVPTGVVATLVTVAALLSINVRHTSAQRRLSQYCAEENIDGSVAKIERVGVANGLLQSVFDYTIEAGQKHSVRFSVDFLGNVEPHRLIEPR